jgi:glutaconate CoA-transferase, subunit A
MAAKKEDKVVSLEQAAALVRDGDVVGLQGMGTQMAPMGMIRELIRAGKKRLKVVQLVGGIGMDWMIAAGCVEKVSYIIVNLDEFGMANNFRREVEAGRLEVEEYTEHQFLTRMQAGAKGLSFGVTRSGLGSQLLETHPDITKVIDCPFTGEKVIAVRALEPDVTILHAHRADKYGNVQFFPKPIWTDVDVFPRAAKKVIVTVEEIVDTDEIRRTPIHTGIPYFKVDAIVELPFGAHPCSLYPQYSFDRAFFTDYASESRTAEGTKKFLDKYVFGPKSHAEYLQLAGGADALLRIRKWS